MNRKQQRFPSDLAALLGLYWILLPIAMLGAWVFPVFLRAKNEGDLTILWVAIALGAVGLILLFWARMPLYRKLRFFTFGPHRLDANHRRVYWTAWILILLSIGLLGLLIAVVQ